jgi:hypothetical protein
MTYNTIAELLADESHWCQGTMARDVNGIGCGIQDDNTMSFCLLGACHKVYGHKMPEVVGKLVERIRGGNSHYPQSALTLWNDDRTRTHAEVLELVRKVGV